MDAPDTARRAFDSWRERNRRSWYDDDPHLASLLRHHGLPEGELPQFGEICARDIDPLARENNRDEHLPVLRRYDGVGNRIEAIDHHPSYHAIGKLAYASGVMTLYGEPGQELASIARMYLFSQNGEAGHACPMACTAGLVKILQSAGNPRPDWMKGLLDPDYAHHLRGAQFLTEVQGGSDVGANAVVARPAPDGGALLTGEKWFCSVIDADLFLVTARPEGASSGTAGVHGYVVPRLRDDGRTNDFRIRRLKYKLGTRSMASAEVDFEGAWALPVGDFRLVMERVIDTSRLLNAVCCGGLLQRALRESLTYAQVRTAFGKPILAFPSLARRVADLRVQAYAARGLTFALAALADRIALGQAPERDIRAYRMLVNLNKFWTSDACTAGVRAAIEVLGGNGAIEEFSVLPRLLRDAIVLEAWEGGHNVLCTQILRDSQRLGLHEPAFEWLAERGAPADALARVRERWNRHLGATSPDAAWHVRDLCEELGPIAQAAALIDEARTAGSDPRLPVVIDHLRTQSQPGWDPLEDGGLPERVRAILA